MDDDELKEKIRSELLGALYPDLLEVDPQDRRARFVARVAVVLDVEGEAAALREIDRFGELEDDALPLALRAGGATDRGAAHRGVRAHGHLRRGHGLAFGALPSGRRGVRGELAVRIVLRLSPQRPHRADQTQCQRVESSW